MPCCPSCWKGGFKDQHAVTMHMSQPTSGCNMWVNDLVSIQESLVPPQVLSSVGNIRSDGDAVSNLVPMDLDEELNSVLDPFTTADDHHWQSSAQSYGSQCDGFYSERFEGAARSFRGGTTFMDKFNRDQFSDIRKSNLYYPFASRSEWELALWLLHVGLSMRALDSFLLLPIVRPSSSLSMAIIDLYTSDKATLSHLQYCQRSSWAGGATPKWSLLAFHANQTLTPYETPYIPVLVRPLGMHCLALEPPVISRPTRPHS